MKLLDLIFPRWCAGCGAPDETLCVECSLEFYVLWQRCEMNAPYLVNVDPNERGDVTPFPVYGLATYRDSAASAIVRWKNVNDKALSGSFMLIAADVGRQLRHSMFPAAHWESTILVPVPSSRNRKRHGTAVVEVFARWLAWAAGMPFEEALTKTGPRRRWVSKLAGLAGRRSSDIRSREAKSRATKARLDLSGVDVVLVDDVLTTGATLSGAARAVREAGGRVVGGLVLAVTEQR